MTETVGEADSILIGKKLGAIKEVQLDEVTAALYISDHESFPLMCRNAEKVLVDDLYQIRGPSQFEGPCADEKDISLCTQDQDCIAKLREFQAYLDKVKEIVKPGCSQEVLNVALHSMSSLVDILSCMSSTSKLHASL